jgi:outer membrane protein TolC
MAAFSPKICLLWVLLLLGVWTSPLRAESLTWEDCVREAAERNPDLQSAERAVQRNQSLVKASRSDFFPQLNAGTGYNASNSTNTSAFNPTDPIAVDIGAQQQFDIEVGLQQNIFSGLKTVSGVKRSKAQLDDVLAELDFAKVQVSADLKIAFARLLFSQQQVGVAKKIVERRQGNVRFVTLRFEGGRETKGSVLRNQALLDQANYDLAQTERALRVAQRDLAKVLGRPYDGNYGDLAVKGNLKPHFSTEAPDFAELTAAHPDFLGAEAQVRTAQADVKLAKGDLYPSVDASATVERRWLLDNNARNLWSAGVNLTYPFFLGGRDIYEVKAARAEEFRLQENQRSTANQLTFTMKQAYSDFKNAVENIRVQENFLKASEVRAEIGRAQYANGLISYQDWDLVENDLINNQRTILESLRDALIAQANWERAQGRGEIP